MECALEWVPVGAATLTGLAVVYQSVLLTRQTSLLRTQLAAQQYAEYTRRYRETTARFPESVNDAQFTLDGLEPNDRTVLIRAMRAYFDLCFEEWHLADLGWIEGAVWEQWTAGISTAMTRPAFRDSWRVIRESASYPASFVKDIDERARS